jgi:hypothetical protein
MSEFKSAAIITAAPWTHRPVRGTALEERCFDGRWHITQTDRGPGAAKDIFLLPREVADGRRPAVGTKGTLIETFEGRESVYRWEPLDPRDSGLPFTWPKGPRYRTRGVTSC